MTLISQNDTSGICPIKWAKEVVQVVAEKSPLIADAFDPMATTSDTRVTYMSFPPIATASSEFPGGSVIPTDPTYVEKQLDYLSVRGQVVASNEWLADIGDSKRAQLTRLMATSALQEAALHIWDAAYSLPTAVTASGTTMDSISLSDLADMTALISPDAVVNAKFYIPSVAWGRIANQAGMSFNAPRSRNAVASILGFDVCLHPVPANAPSRVAVLFGDASKGFAFGTPSDSDPVVRISDQPLAATDQSIVSVFWRIVVGALDNSGGMTCLKLAS